MKKILEVPKSLQKNILNYNMEKSEKSFYVIIENKRCGKFSGVTPIQVAKKVASKKLKTSKKTEIIFYLDEVGGKKKRYGPYQMRKDKKTNKITVSVIKKMNIMKGGVLTDDIKIILKKFFDDNRFAEKNPKNVMKPMYNKAITLQFKYFYNEPIVFFLSFYSQTDIASYLYKYAVFKESNGSIYIMFYTESTEPTKFTSSTTSTSSDFKIISFTDFFLNPEYNSYFTDNHEGYAWLTEGKLNKLEILEFLKDENKVPSRIIRAEADRIYDFLYKPISYPENIEKVIIYIPDYSHPLIRKCVYLNLTFGILDEENTGIIPSTSFIQEPPTSNLQKFLIMKQSLVGGFSEPIIYFRVPSESNPQSIFFTHCIFTESRTSKNLKIAIYNNGSITINNFNDLSINNYLYYILLQIPRQMGTLERVRMIANSKFNPEQLRIDLQTAFKQKQNKKRQQQEQILQSVFQGRRSNQRQLEQHLPLVRPQLNGLQQQQINELKIKINDIEKKSSMFLPKQVEQMKTLKNMINRLKINSSPQEQQIKQLQQQIEKLQKKQQIKELTILGNKIDELKSIGRSDEDDSIQNLLNQITKLKVKLYPKQNFPSSSNN